MNPAEIEAYIFGFISVFVGILIVWGGALWIFGMILGVIRKV